MSIGLGYIHAGDGKIAFMESIWQFQSHDRDARNLLRCGIGAEGAFHEDNRNRVAQSFLAHPKQPEWLLTIDTDIKFAIDVPYALFDHGEYLRSLWNPEPIDSPIISALYFSYVGDMFVPVWFRRKGEHTGEYQSLLTLEPKLIELDGIGMGCALIHRSVFEKIQAKFGPHWFDREWVETDSGPKKLGEDLAFCRRAKEVGCLIFGDARWEVGHIKSRVENFATMMERVNATKVSEVVA